MTSGEDVYDKIDRTRREVLTQLNRWRLRRELELDELRRDNASLREALAMESANTAKLRVELKNLSRTADQTSVPESPRSPTSRRRLPTENARASVSLWNNTKEEKEKVFAVLKDDRTA